MPGFALTSEGHELVVAKLRQINEATAVIQALLELPMTRERLQKELRTLDAPQHELSVALEPSALRGHRFNAVDTFLYLLEVAYEQKGAEFSRVLGIQGRDRRYFAKSKEEIESSGTGTQPRKIGNSDYWLMTNSTTRAKRQTIRRVLRLLGYSEEAVTAAAGVFRAA